MTSLLSGKISLCESIEKLEENQCFDVIRLLQQEIGCTNLNQLLIKIIMKMEKTFTHQLLQTMDNKIRDNITYSRHVSDEIFSTTQNL